QSDRPRIHGSAGRGCCESDRHRGGEGYLSVLRDPLASGRKRRTLRHIHLRTPDCAVRQRDLGHVSAAENVSCLPAPARAATREISEAAVQQVLSNISQRELERLTTRNPDLSPEEL